MLERQLHRARIISSIAATLISLACGTNYVYSAWAPQFADRLGLSATNSNLVGLAGNLGMYSCGVPAGILVDTKGPRPAVIIGSILLGVGYFPLHQAYDSASGSVPFLCIFSFLTGLGGCLAFQGAVKTSALNWPRHRGTATAFPLAAFGLSAFFFSLCGSIFFPGDTSAFLAVLAIGTFSMTLGGFFFLRVLPHSHYQAVPGGGAGSTGGMSGSQLLRRTSSEAKNSDAEPGESSLLLPKHTAHSSPSPVATASPTQRAEAPTPYAAPGQDQPVSSTSGLAEPSIAAAIENDDGLPHQDSESGVVAEGMVEDDADETSSLVSSPSSLAGEMLVDSSVDRDRSHRVDIRGFNLLRQLEFWQQFSIMGILSAIGLMTINNIGNDVIALWKKYDPSVDEAFLVSRQQMHVSILSICSFSGRLLSGVGSDFLVKVLHASRVWCLVLASFIFGVGQVSALSISNPHFLGFVSGLSGLGYGFLFGVFPSIVAESFGIHGLSQNWGFMTLSPVVGGNIFNLFYGAVYDAHSVVGENGERTCPDGLACYWAAYLVTLGACALGLVVSLSVIRHQYQERLAEARGRPD